MTQNDADFERDLSDAFAPVSISAEFQQRLIQLPQLHAQRRANLFNRLLPSRLLPGGMRGFGVSSWSAFGMTAGTAAACLSLVIGLSLGLNGAVSQSQSTQTTTVASTYSSGMGSSNTNGNGYDDVSLLYAAADLPGDVP